MTELLQVGDLRTRPRVEPAATAAEEILCGLDLTVGAGEVHAVVGPNGSGKSTLGATLLGAPEYEVMAGSIVFRGDDVTDWPADERAKAGMFLGFRHPERIPGVSVLQLLARSTRPGGDLSVPELRIAAIDWSSRLGIDPAFVDRRLGEQLSVVEQRCCELIQLALAEPELAILDESDTGHDSAAVGLVAAGIHTIRSERPSMGIVLITDDRQLLDEIDPDHVHVLRDGRIVASGGVELADVLVREGAEASGAAV